MNSRVLLAATLLLLAACGEGDSGGGPAAVFALRPVIEESAPPCPDEAPERDLDIAAERKDGEVAACLTLGPPIVDASDVRSAALGDLPEDGGKAVSIVLGRTGATNLDSFAARALGKRLAILAEGRLVRAPVVRSPSFAGRIEVVGLSDDDATALFRKLRQYEKRS